MDMGDGSAAHPPSLNAPPSAAHQSQAGALVGGGPERG